MNKRNAVIAFAALILIAAGIYFLYPRETPKPQFGGAKDQPCPGETIEIENPDGHLGTIAKKGQKLKITLNWYACNPLERDALVYYRFSSTLDPIVRIVRAVPGDKFKVVRDEKRGAWNLEVNGALIMNEDGKDPYFFGGKPPATLSLYEKQSKGVLGNGDVIMFAAIAPGQNDSGIFGVANVVDIVGRVEPVPQ
ncbi:MAG: hypothetical protein ABL958_08875 [Bdellovibrionia bacterium]